MKQSVLIIDDHPAMIEGYKSILSFNTHSYELEFKSAHSSEEAYGLILGEPLFDIVLLDLSLPAYLEKEIHSGEDLIPHIRKYQPQSKVIIITSHAEQFLLYRIYKKTSPDGIFIKSDFSSKEFLVAFDTVAKGEKYYTQTMKEALKKINDSSFYLDSIDMQLISLLAQGMKSKSLTEHLPLSLSAIDKRKQKIREFFSVEKGNDEDIVREAKKQKFV